MSIDTGLKVFVFIVIAGAASALAWALFATNPALGTLAGVGGLVLASLLASSLRMATQWERAVVLTMGRFTGIRGPGLFFLTPLAQSVSALIDLRTITSTFRAEQAITGDTVPVDVDAVLFWRVTDPEKAALEVAAYDQAVGWAAQTALRDVIGRSTLADILSGREKI